MVVRFPKLVQLPMPSMVWCCDTGRRRAIKVLCRFCEWDTRIFGFPVVSGCSKTAKATTCSKFANEFQTFMSSSIWCRQLLKHRNRNLKSKNIVKRHLLGTVRVPGTCVSTTIAAIRQPAVAGTRDRHKMVQCPLRNKSDRSLSSLKFSEPLPNRKPWSRWAKKASLQHQALRAFRAESGVRWRIAGLAEASEASEASEGSEGSEGFGTRLHRICGLRLPPAGGPP